MKTVPLVMYQPGGERIVIGKCDVESTEQGGWLLKGIIEDEKFSGVLESKNNPDLYSVSFHIPDHEAVEVAYVPLPAIPAGRAQFTASLPPLPWRD